MQHVGSKFLNQGSKPHLHWKHRILTTGQPGKSLDFLFRLHLQGFLTLVCGSCLVAKSFPTLCGPLDCSPPGSSVHGISQARPLEWVVISLSRKSSLLRNRTCLSCIANGFFTTEPAYFFFPPREGNGNPLQYSGQENLMDRRAWSTTVHGVTEFTEWLSTSFGRSVGSHWFIYSSEKHTHGNTESNTTSGDLHQGFSW